MPVTINDVAKQAGVSPKTVSNVIHEYPYVREATRVRVLDAIEVLGYQPNIAARSLVTKRNNLIGFVLWDILNPGYTEMVDTIVATTREAGYMVILSSAGRDLEEEERIATLLIQQRVDGVILASTTQGSNIPRRLIDAGIAVVMVSRYLEDVPCDYVVVDNRKGGYLVTCHLLALGHRRIAFIRGTPNASTSLEREAGYRQALVEYDIPYDESLVDCGHYTSQGAYAAAKRLLSIEDPPTAIVCSNDLMAISVIDAVMDSDLRVPEDVAVTGYDNIAWADSRSLALTSVKVSMDMMAEEAVLLLLRRIQGDITGPPRRVILSPELVVRRTSGAVPGKRRTGVLSAVRLDS